MRVKHVLIGLAGLVVVVVGGVVVVWVVVVLVVAVVVVGVVVGVVVVGVLAVRQSTAASWLMVAAPWIRS